MKPQKSRFRLQKVEVMEVEVNATRLLAEFAAETDYEDLPEDVIKAGKRVILDTVGCAIGGYFTEAGKAIINVERSLGGRPESTIVVTGDRTSCANAAFVNAELANALDADETLMNKSHHANCAVAAALAVGESVGAGGQEVLTAALLGYEVAGRIGLALRTIHVGKDGQLELLPQSGMGWAIFGAAVAAAKLLGQDADEMANTIGIAAYGATIPMLGRWGKMRAPRPMTKYAFYASLAHSGVVAALLTPRGFLGDTTVLDGDYGFWKLSGASSCDWEFMTGELGQRWLITRTSFKQYPACRFISGPLDLFRDITREHRLAPQDIAKVNVKVFSVAIKQGLNESVTPVNDVDAQFSIPFSIAAASLGDAPSPYWQTPDKWRDPRVIEFSKKVSVDIEPTAHDIINEQLVQKGYFKEFPATVEILTTDGRTYTASSKYPKGDPWEPEAILSDEELKDKFRRYSSGLLSSRQVEEAIEMLYELEDVIEVGDLMSLLALEER